MRLCVLGTAASGEATAHGRGAVDRRHDRRKGRVDDRLSEYKSGSILGEELVDAVPEIKQYANVRVEQVVNVGSPNSRSRTGSRSPTASMRIFAGDPEVAGVVITHGTNTLEETAYFLNLTVKHDRPVVLVGSQRPATAISADGRSIC